MTPTDSITNYKKQFGLNLSNYRKRKGYTQSVLAELTGSSVSHIGGIEQGRHNFSSTLLWQLCHILEVTPQQLFTFTF